MLIRQWDAEPLTVVYDPVRGDTHLLDPLLVEILRLISERPQNEAELFEKLADAMDCTSHPEALSLIDAALIRLQEMGLAKQQFP